MLLQFPMDKPLSTVEGMMLCPNLPRPGGTGVTHMTGRSSMCKIRNLENKQDLEMEMDRTQLPIIEWKWRTSPVPVMDEDR